MFKFFVILPFLFYSCLCQSNECGYGVGSCADGKCCSEFGWCGYQSAYCGSGCQIAYGSCDQATLPIKAPTAIPSARAEKAPSTIPTVWAVKEAAPTTAMAPPSNECGYGVGSCAAGECCSEFGWCGDQSDYCGSGCQIAYGTCNSPQHETSPIQRPTPAFIGEDRSFFLFYKLKILVHGTYNFL